MPDSHHAATNDMPMVSLAGETLLPKATRAPPHVAGYKITRLLGAGGMGAVYEAWQEKPHRRVALKILLSTLSPTLLRRFSLEVEILGRLEHPAIARIYDAGSAEAEGHIQPFFAMEFIEGQPITQYAQQRNLSTRERVDLLRRVAEGVHHAHQKGVIHRDLKPANILVDAQGQPKILDFGVARVTEADIQLTTMPQDAGVVIGTLSYMSPEQADGNTKEMDVRTDVYALGIIAFELLTGQRPYRLEAKLIHEAARMIHEQEPTRLGTINRTFRGDLEIIVHKAIEKDKEQRYASAAALADDLRRYLADKPIEARPPSRWYQIKKFSRRHMALVGAGLMGISALVAGLVLASAGLVKAKRAEDKARGAEAEAIQQKDRAQTNLRKALDTVDQFTSFVTDGTLADIPEAAPAREQLLRDAVAFYEQLAANNPGDVQLKENLTLALTHLAAFYRKSGKLPQAIETLEQRINKLHELVAAKPQASEYQHLLATALADAGHVYLEQKNYASAQSLYEQALAIRRSLVRQNPDHAEYQATLAYNLQDMGEALASDKQNGPANSAFEESYQLYGKLIPRHPDRRQWRINFAYLLGQWSNLLAKPEAIAKLQEACFTWKALLLEDPQDENARKALAWSEKQLDYLAENSKPRPTPPPAPSQETAAPSTPSIRLDALDTDGLLQAAGKQVLVQGRILLISLNCGQSKLAIINFHEHKSSLRCLIHRNVIDEFTQVFGHNLQALTRQTVEIEGIVSIFKDIPQIVLSRPDQIRLVAAAEAKPAPAPRPPPQEPGAQAGKTVTTGTIEGRITRVGSSPSVGLTFVNFDAKKDEGIVAVIREPYLASITQALGGTPAEILPGKTIRVTGSLYLYNNQLNVEIQDPKQISIVPGR